MIINVKKMSLFSALVVLLLSCYSADWQINFPPRVQDQYPAFIIMTTVGIKMFFTTPKLLCKVGSTFRIRTTQSIFFFSL